MVEIERRPGCRSSLKLHVCWVEELTSALFVYQTRSTHPPETLYFLLIFAQAWYVESMYR